MFAATHLTGFGANGSAGGFSALGAAFDGSDDYLSRGAELTGMADGKAGTFSGWIKLSGGDASVMRWLHNDLGLMTVYRGSDNKIHIEGYTSGSSKILEMVSTRTFTTSTLWVHVMASWDLAATTGHLYIDGVDDKAGGATLTNNTIDYTRANWYVGARQAPDQYFNGSMAEIWFHPSYIDLSNSANRALFFNLGSPADVGIAGSIPLGLQPLLYLKGPAAAMNKNVGSGGDFTVNGGGLVDASNAPAPRTIWNANDKSANITLSNGDRTATNGTAAFRAVRDLYRIPPYKAYYEIIVDNGVPIVGIGNSSATLSNYVGSDANGWGWQTGSSSKVWYNGSNWAYTGAGDTGASDIIMIAIDSAAQKFWGGRNGTWHNSGNPAAGTGNAPFGTAIPSSGGFLMASVNTAVQFATIKQTPTYPVPTGFTFVAGP